jgi:predicted DsbA family dithiol-disulfide isomerase
MKIIAIYNDQLFNYVEKISQMLEQDGYSVDLIKLEEYSSNQNITSIPTFLIQKEGKDGYALKGKNTIGAVLEWAKNSGAKDN